MSLLEQMKINFQNSLNMTIFSFLKTNDPFVNTIITTLFLTVTTYIAQLFYSFWNNPNDFSFFSFDIWKNIFYRKNVIIIEGSTINSQDSNGFPLKRTLFSSHFRAVWNEIANRLEHNNSIYQVKNILASNELYFSNRKKEDNLFLVIQQKPFLFDEKLQIYATTRMTSEQRENAISYRPATQIQTIQLTLYSYVSSLNQIKEYIDQKALEYEKSLQSERGKSKFIYSLINTRCPNNSLDCWKETLFTTTRSFQNMFFENKETVLSKVNFFLHNESWYKEKGIPYTLGIGLYGPPGTGKTSFIKSLAVETNRHIISLSLKTIKKRSQLLKFFFESRYNTLNTCDSIGFDKKILVIEDIDAQGDIVLERKTKEEIMEKEKENKGTIEKEQEQEQEQEKENKKEQEKEKERKKYIFSNLFQQQKQLQKQIEKQQHLPKEKKTVPDWLLYEKTDVIKSLIEEEEDADITLDDILNLWDGIQETSGRIMIITSNHYDKLDSAITRPGRIDIALEMKNANNDIIKEMYYHFYGNDAPQPILETIENYIFSPAEIVNFLVLYKTEPLQFIETLKHHQTKKLEIKSKNK